MVVGCMPMFPKFYYCTNIIETSLNTLQSMMTRILSKGSGQRSQPSDRLQNSTGSQSSFGPLQAKMHEAPIIIRTEVVVVQESVPADQLNAQHYDSQPTFEMRRVEKKGNNGGLKPIEEV